jgi:hypothetical protein
MTDTVKQHPNTVGLRHWSKGQSGNPNGRPRKDNCLTSLLQIELKKKPKVVGKDGLPNDKTWAQLLAEALPAAAYKALLKGDIKPYALLIERTDGKVTQPIGGPDGGPIPIQGDFIHKHDWSKIPDEKLEPVVRMAEEFLQQVSEKS